ncbi:RNA 2'-phosphotransferase [Seonamhaeicola marinus]|uniref:Probable RNA 2'-phosphotransferase n=1 Tax=Seonamhaeicola marinus TaxID=1912246 RepID=A0A5D0IA22_9FLAO|nr:RNA 2'-phosphotransferase [Seonamhaeicola marinus]TYA78612.1 RNA 2'-phosphotransferase [Seonamhaeicola marinus]
MTEQQKKKLSKFLSYILRHHPDAIGLKLDDNGWANVNDLLSTPNMRFSMEDLEEVVATNDKKRFSFNADKTKIRANQGHSLKTVDLELKAQTPPKFLYHGTVAKFIPEIRLNGLIKMSRQHVHLSKDRDTAVKVGSRRGNPIILSIRALDMHNSGKDFFISDNGVWLTDHIPAEFIDFTE